MSLVDTEPLQRVERELGLLLRRAHSSAATMAHRVHPDLDPGAYPILARIAQVPGIRASEIAEHIGVGRGTMSRQLARLEDLGLITRTTDPDDSRGQLIHLTEGGETRVADARGARGRFLRTALDAWSHDELDALAAQLTRLNTDLDEARRRVG
ncbi:MarR family winged helix-turn-helix transcriptional regulator [Cellulomonas sp. P22]|uniref:MarR family winged helix-turn-helix transcriptional regulator n=1 Tax=Cellulomonas sp. P22 TaxID=3373189 RepID=UPI0037B2B076